MLGYLFLDSLFKIICTFDLIHNDLWTSPLTHDYDYKYYLYIVDDDCTYLHL
jgi:hypothetical protein